MSEYTPKVGHRVRVTTVREGVVEGVDRGSVLLDGRSYVATLRGATRTWERLPDPEPEWQEGDMVMDAEGRPFRRGKSRASGQWDWQYGCAVVPAHYPVRPLTRLVPEVRDDK